MPGQRRPGGRSRGSWTPRIVGLIAIVLIAGAGAAVYVLKFRPADDRPAPLPTAVVSSQTVGLVAEATVTASSGHSGVSLVQMLVAGGVPVFTPLSPAAAASAQGSPQWVAALMGGNGYIFIFHPDGECLAAERRARLVFQHCDLGRAQRWRPLSKQPLVQDGHDFYQYANLADGKCLAEAVATAGAREGASLATCRPGQPPSQMIAFWWSTQ